MNEQTLLTVMDAMAEKIEALTERVAAAEKKLAEKCSCLAWAGRLRPDAGYVKPSDSGFLTRGEEIMLIRGVGE